MQVNTKIYKASRRAALVADHPRSRWSVSMAMAMAMAMAMMGVTAPFGFSVSFLGFYILGFLYHLGTVGALLISKMGRSRICRH